MMDWLIRASDMTVEERNKIFMAITEVEMAREKKGDYRKMFAYTPCHDWVNGVSPLGIEEKRKCYHKTDKAESEVEE